MSKKGQHLIKHGLHGIPEYKIWKDMRKRCNNPNNSHYYRYGGRGISVCKEWDDFATFLKDMGPRPVSEEKMTIDRIDNDKGYEPGNCRWVTNAENLRNTSKNRFIEFRGETKCLNEWASILGIPRERIKARLDRDGWSVERAFTEPLGESHEARTFEFNGISDTLHGWERRTGIPRQTIRTRIDFQGWSIEKAVTTPGRKHGKSTISG